MIHLTPEAEAEAGLIVFFLGSTINPPICREEKCLLYSYQLLTALSYSYATFPLSA